MSEKFTIGIIVSNHFGVLSRVAGLYAKRGYNIDSLAVGVTENPAFSRMTIVSSGDEYMRDQVMRQLEKLHDVKMVTLLEKGASVSNEHLLIKLKINGTSKAEISELINDYGGKVMDFSGDFITAELTGRSEKIDRLIDAARNIGILELCRSGAIAMTQGMENALNIARIRDY
ncbi:MAG: acetolactate synthase small subunit [Treponema sp.]|nr:acetolactate synthase small subunit [Treponema sp.]